MNKKYSNQIKKSISLARFIRCSLSGQTITEYILLIAFISFIAIGLNNLFAKTLRSYFNRIASIRTGVAGTGP